MKQMLIEHMTGVRSRLQLTEAISKTTGKSKGLYINGIFAEADILNGNGRIYPRHELKAAVDSFNEMVKSGVTLVGELNHPQSLSINLDKTSHHIVEMKLVDNKVIGRAKILPTPSGNIAKTLILEGIKLGVSTRGRGNLLENVVADFELVTVDIVATPSSPNAFPTAVMENMMYANNNVMMLAEAMTHDENAQKYLARELKKIIVDLFNK